MDNHGSLTRSVAVIGLVASYVGVSAVIELVSSPRAVLYLSALSWTIIGTGLVGLSILRRPRFQSPISQSIAGRARPRQPRSSYVGRWGKTAMPVLVATALTCRRYSGYHAVAPWPLALVLPTTVLLVDSPGRHRSRLTFLFDKPGMVGLAIVTMCACGALYFPADSAPSSRDLWLSGTAAASTAAALAVYSEIASPLHHPHPVQKEDPDAAAANPGPTVVLAIGLMSGLMAVLTDSEMSLFNSSNLAQPTSMWMLALVQTGLLVAMIRHVGPAAVGCSIAAAHIVGHAVSVDSISSAGFAVLLLGSVAVFGPDGSRSVCGLDRWRMGRSKGCVGAFAVLVTLLLVVGALLGPVPVDVQVQIGTVDHPIGALAQAARAEFAARVKSQSRTLDEAVAEYRRRYLVHPPPHFDVWFRFAKRHGYVMIDDFDGLSHDLAPFWALSPQTIRAKAAELVGSGHANIIGFSIRNGTVRLSDPDATDDWFSGEVIESIMQFAHVLPDFDLAVNRHDEPAVAVASADLGRLVERAADERAAATTARRPRNRFSTSPVGSLDRDGGAITFANLSRQSGWETARRSCPGSSPVWTGSDDRMAYTNTTAPVEFIANLTAAQDVCASPSLAESFGTFVQTNVMHVTDQLVPVFSQSKLSSFQDVLFPSPWYRAGRTVDPGPDEVEWDDKIDKLYWRGSTTGGFSDHGSWRRQHRQKAVMAVNGLDDPGTPDRHIHTPAVLVRKPRLETDDGRAGGWTVEPTAMVRHSDRLNIRFSHVGQCSSVDCAAQTAYFAVGGRIDYSEAFRNRFLLDLDGNAFSGRFHSLLRSKSVVMKMSMFSEWTQSCNLLVPWVHYIPLSISKSEWIETVRFMIDEEDGKTIGKEMAVHKSDWARRTLRKVDLDVWMFRLLLEYGRLVDDDRARIGFVV